VLDSDRYKLRIGRGLGLVTLGRRLLRCWRELRIGRGLGLVTLATRCTQLREQLRIGRGLGLVTLIRVPVIVRE